MYNNDVSYLLEVRHLTTHFHTQEGTVHAVNDVSFEVQEGEILGIVGESGCGKSVTMLSVMGLIPQPPGKIEGGEIIFEDRNLLKLNDSQLRSIRGQRMAMIFQDPMTSLNPVLKIGLQITEALHAHKKTTARQAHARTVELLDMVGIPRPAERMDDYPHQFSGGMRQRVMIAMALACNPKLLIADEPTTALDVTIQAQIIDLVKNLQEKLGMAVIWITHDLGVVARLVQRVIVMYAGSIIEQGPVVDLYKSPRHPYTLGLLASLPRLNEKPGTKLVSIPGQPPDMVTLSQGCPFGPRCPYASDCMEKGNASLYEVSPAHYVACWRERQPDT
jgi:oligopeptide transport system ATP-binding protein